MEIRVETRRDVQELGKVLAPEVLQDQARNLSGLLDMRRAWQWTSLAGRVGSEQGMRKQSRERTSDYGQGRELRGAGLEVGSDEVVWLEDFEWTTPGSEVRPGRG